MKKASVSRWATFLSAGILASVTWYAMRRRKWSKQKLCDGSDDSTNNVDRFTNKTVLITGAAGDIGSATAYAFAHRGATLVLVDLPSTQEKLLNHQINLMKEGAKSVHVLTADVTKVEDVQTMVSDSVKICGRIDCFFNNAGIQGELLPLNEQSDEMFQRTIQVNLFGVFLGMKYVSKAMIEAHQGGGVIVNTASMAGLMGPPNMTAYAASKHGVIGMTKTGAKDLAPYNIRVCAIAPGLLEGNMWKSQVKGRAKVRKKEEGKDDELTPDEIELQEKRMLEATPLKRLGRLSEVAEVVVFLCSERASYVTGSVINIDGGRLQ